jgi:hypothetical protein
MFSTFPVEWRRSWGLGIGPPKNSHSATCRGVTTTRRALREK